MLDLAVVRVEGHAEGGGSPAPVVGIHRVGYVAFLHDKNDDMSIPSDLVSMVHGSSDGKSLLFSSF